MDECRFPSLYCNITSIKRGGLETNQVSFPSVEYVKWYRYQIGPACSSAVKESFEFCGKEQKPRTTSSRGQFNMIGL